MISFDMKCPEGHVFEGWFGSSGDFENQRTRGLLTCPVCGHPDIVKAPMAPNVATRRGHENTPARPGDDADGTPRTPPPSAGNIDGQGGGVAVDGVQGADRMIAMLRQLRRFVENNAENVGKGFADEARRIHNGESEERGIYGNATPEEVEDLRDDGIEVASIPWLPDRDH